MTDLDLASPFSKSLLQVKLVHRGKDNSFKGVQLHLFSFDINVY